MNHQIILQNLSIAICLFVSVIRQLHCTARAQKRGQFVSYTGAFSAGLPAAEDDAVGGRRRMHASRDEREGRNTRRLPLPPPPRHLAERCDWLRVGGVAKV
ncbi:hypothetical protein BU25DRAFT_273253 [Macroventuria anomochaeta]|uniref:Uncharacterized protein n=1 Tax=Macroventuria anomochaeta TaxID=301207 RepID=A0ACB6S6R4_9PLEO|nr:uncharacterized protein BU25DRAFT_273253 [Macroventuria anomochaeta]KAF2629733.1 hypothetical protein BU25DRAFT_273253 [Macroventuria anomochaeta]